MVGVSYYCQQLTGFPDNGVPGLMSGSQGSPAHFREKSTDRKRSSHQSHYLPLEPFPLGLPGAFS